MTGRRIHHRHQDRKASMHEILSEIRENHHVQEMKRFCQHGRVSTYEHCESVARVSAAIDCTTTTARGMMTGSCRPRTQMLAGLPSVRIVVCGMEMDGVGLKAARKMMGEPSLMPPRIPPA